MSCSYDREFLLQFMEICTDKPDSLPALEPLGIGKDHSTPRSALASARIIEDLDSISYPDGTRSPHPDLNVNAEKGKFWYVVHDGP
jgi:hypothetical protein